MHFPQAGVAVHRSLGEVSDHKGRAHIGEAEQRGAQVCHDDGYSLFIGTCMIRYQLEEFLGRDERNQEDLESLQLHIQEQEGVIRWSSIHLYLYLY